MENPGQIRVEINTDAAVDAWRPVSEEEPAFQ